MVQPDKAANENGIEIKISSSVLNQSKGIDSEQTKKQHVDFFSRTQISPVDVKRYTELGASKVRSLGFREDEQRQTVLKLLESYPLSNRLPEILSFIQTMGADEKPEIRHYAASAVSSLSVRLPFLDLKEAVIAPWAKSKSSVIRESAAIVLSQLILDEQHKNQVLSLLKHWVNVNNKSLTDTALYTFTMTAASYPNEAFDAIGKILKAGRFLHYPDITDLFGLLYEKFPQLAVKRMYQWLKPFEKSDLCLISAIFFLLFVQFEDVTSDAETGQKAAEIIVALWDTPKHPGLRGMHENVTRLVETWAGRALKNGINTGSRKDNPDQLFFNTLHQQFEGRRNRLAFHLERWERNRVRKMERKKARAAYRGNKESVKTEPCTSYLSLIQQPGISQ
ncbi:MAG: hypothetical protein GY737_27835 [Desulfobacteraceae bacterium]|nr:hypothetical protein [Desulfobacteraceae bacterium]